MKDLYNRIRPRDFSDMVVTSDFLKDADEMVKATLDGKPGLPHVMIFYSRNVPGLGKTTCARILGIKLNPSLGPVEIENIHSGLSSMICVEVNATDMKKPEVAALIAEMMKAGTDLYGYKYIYIINEAHKLTDDSFQLMLSVEDLPDNVYVIMTTTEMPKIRNDLLSRIRTYTFKPPSDAAMSGFLQAVVEEYQREYPYSSKYPILPENSVYSDITTMASGSIRKALILIEQYMQTGTVSEPDDNTQGPYESHRLFFNDFLNTWVRLVAQPKNRTSWSDIAAKFVSITRTRNGRQGMSYDNLRMGILFNIQNRLSSEEAVTTGLGIDESYVYSVLEKHLLDYLLSPPGTNITLRMHMAFMEIILFREERGNLFVTPS